MDYSKISVLKLLRAIKSLDVEFNPEIFADIEGVQLSKSEIESILSFLRQREGSDFETVDDCIQYYLKDGKLSDNSKSRLGMFLRLVSGEINIKEYTDNILAETQKYHSKK